MPGRGSCGRCGALALGMALTYSCAACRPDDGDLEAHRSDGVRYYTRYLEPGTPVAGPDSLAGRFAVEDGCVVLRLERFTVIPVFIPNAQVSDDRTTLTVGHTSLSLNGAAVEVGGQVLSRRQAANLGYDVEGVCGRPTAFPFAFVYG